MIKPSIICMQTPNKNLITPSKKKKQKYKSLVTPFKKKQLTIPNKK